MGKLLCFEGVYVEVPVCVTPAVQAKVYQARPVEMEIQAKSLSHCTSLREALQNGLAQWLGLSDATRVKLTECSAVQIASAGNDAATDAGRRKSSQKSYHENRFGIQILIKFHQNIKSGSNAFKTIFKIL